jgi:hypothetical protein
VQAPPRATISAEPATKPPPRREAQSRIEERERRVQTPVIAPLVAGLEGRSPSLWIQRILELRQQDRRAEADALLAEFKQRYPEEPLPATLR